jgi:hypothetical protein
MGWLAWRSQFALIAYSIGGIVVPVAGYLAGSVMLSTAVAWTWLAIAVPPFLSAVALVTVSSQYQGPLSSVELAGLAISTSSTGLYAAYFTLVLTPIAFGVGLAWRSRGREPRLPLEH